MSTPNQSPDAPDFALDEGAMRALVAEKHPELLTDDPAGPGPEPAVTELEDEAEETPAPEIVPPAEETETQAEDDGAKAAEETAAKKKADDDAKAVATEEAAKIAAAHPDLAVPADPHMKPKTRKVIDSFKQKAIDARASAAKSEEARAALQKQYDEAQAQIKSGKPPKEIEDELTLLRERVRELDVSRDPAIENKYDKPIGKNTDAAVELLGQMGLFRVAMEGKDGVKQLRDMTDQEKAKMTAKVKADGISIRSMAGYIKKLEEVGDVENAEVLRDLARQNDQLARDKASEIATVKTGYEARSQAKTKEQQAQQEQISNITKTTGEKTLQADIAELAKTFPAIAVPPEPLATDAPAVAAAKKAAIAEYAKAADQVKAAVATFNETGLAPDKAAEARGRLTAAAVKAVILQQHVLPKMAKDLTAAQARIKELEAKVGQNRNAGALNRAHAAAISQVTPSGERQPAAAASVPLLDAAAGFFKANGVDTGT